MENVMLAIGVALLFMSMVWIVCYFDPSCHKEPDFNPSGRKEPESTDYFRIRYNPKKDITAYEVAKLQTILGPFAFTRTLKVIRNSETDMEAWNKIPVLMQRHFDIVEDTRL
jgi:hypothetical protein